MTYSSLCQFICFRSTRSYLSYLFDSSQVKSCYFCHLDSSESVRTFVQFFLCSVLLLSRFVTKRALLYTRFVSNHYILFVPFVLSRFVRFPILLQSFRTFCQIRLKLFRTLRMIYLKSIVSLFMQDTGHKTPFTGSRYLYQMHGSCSFCNMAHTSTYYYPFHVICVVAGRK